MRDNIFTKDEFVDVMNQLKKAIDFQDSLNDFFRSYNSDSEIYGIPDGVETTFRALETMFNDEGDWIRYFVWEKYFGREYEQGDITGEDGEDIPLRNAEDLYDLLIENMLDDSDSLGGD